MLQQDNNSIKWINPHKLLTFLSQTCHLEDIKLVYNLSGRGVDMRKKHIITICVAIIIVVIIGGIGFYVKNSKESGEKATIKTTTEKVTKGNLTVGLVEDGKVSLALTALNFPIQGTIKEIKVTNGQEVKAGDVLATLDDSGLQQDLIKANNSYKKAQVNYDDAVNQRELNIFSEKQKLDQLKTKADGNPNDLNAQSDYAVEKKKYDNMVNSTSSIDNAKIALSDAENNLNSAKNNLAKAILKAPIDGKVIDIGYKIGELVDGNAKNNTAAVTLCDSSKITVKASVNESDIKSISVGQSMSISVDATAEENIKGKVTDVKAIPKVDSSGVVSYEVTGVFDQGDDKIMDGMSCVITFLKNQREGVLLIPNKAVFIENQKQYVNIENSQGKTEKTEIKTGLSNGNKTEVLSGLEEGQTLIIGGVKK